MEKSYRSELVGVFGDPIDENPTVVTIEAGFRALNLNYRYITMLVKKEDLRTAIQALKALHFKGINLTIPHKVEVLQYLDHIAPDAQIMGAVNTVYIKNGETYGENTDGKGFITSLKEADVQLEGKKAVVLGAGGAARAITVELAMAGTREIVLVNRGKERGEALAELLNSKTKAKAVYVPWEKSYQVPADADLLVNATNIGLYPDTGKPDLDYATVLPSMVVCDVIPNPPQTAFLMQAKAKGCKTLDGLSMLVNQGAIGFELWTGQKAPVREMKKALEEEFQVK